jgi:hypothetical protein
LLTKLETAFDAGDSAERLLFTGVLIGVPLGEIDGPTFRNSFKGGTVELRRNDVTVLTATLTPEPSTALLLGSGLLGLASLRRHGRARRV